MQALIAARLDTLSPERKSLLQDASVIERPREARRDPFRDSFLARPGSGPFQPLWAVMKNVPGDTETPANARVLALP